MSSGIIKSSRRILLPYRNLLLFEFRPAKGHAMANYSSKLPINLDHSSHYPFRMLGFRRMINCAQRPPCLPSSNFGQSRVISRYFSLSTTNRDVSVIARVASGVRDFSTSVKTRVSENSFERIYLQGGLNAKPLVADGIDKVNNIVEEEETRSEVGGDNVSPKTSVEETHAEKEAWELLQNAVVKYCGDPVGTVAANDPGDDTVELRSSLSSGFHPFSTCFLA